MKEWLPRLTEALTVNLMKEDILESGTKYQIGGVPGHRVEEHLLVIKKYYTAVYTKKVWCDDATRGHPEFF